jgi:hypothetical protein
LQHGPVQIKRRRGAAIKNICYGHRRGQSVKASSLSMGADVTMPKRQGLWSAAAMGPYEFSIIMSRRRTNRFGKIQALEGAGV